jgi:hypothetical protein
MSHLVLPVHLSCMPMAALSLLLLLLLLFETGSHSIAQPDLKLWIFLSYPPYATGMHHHAQLFVHQLRVQLAP